MTPEELRKRLAELVLAELKANNDKPEWYYISIAAPRSVGFVGGCYVKARGPMEAWKLMHTLNLYPDDCGGETQTIKIPEGKQHLVELDHEMGKTYRLLSAEEVNPGK